MVLLLGWGLAPFCWPGVLDLCVIGFIPVQAFGGTLRLYLQR